MRSAKRETPPRKSTYSDAARFSRCGTAAYRGAADGSISRSTEAEPVKHLGACARTVHDVCASLCVAWFVGDPVVSAGTSEDCGQCGLRPYPHLVLCFSGVDSEAPLASNRLSPGVESTRIRDLRLMRILA